MRWSDKLRWTLLGAAIALATGGVSLTHADELNSGARPVFVPLAHPCRLVDTRPASQVGVKSTPIGAGGDVNYDIQVVGGSGQCTGDVAVPLDAAAVAVNVTAIAPSAPITGRSYLSVYPSGEGWAGTSNLNFVDGQAPVANKVDVGLGAGRITIYNDEGTVHVAVDVFGYYIHHSHDDRYIPTIVGGSVILPGSAFRAVDPTTELVANDSDGAYVTGGPGVLQASFAVPPTAYVKGIIYFFVDGSTESLQLDVVYTLLGASSQGVVAELSHTTAGADPLVRSVFVDPDTDYYPTADRSLAIRASNPSWGEVPDGDLVVKTVVISYGWD